MGLTVNKTEELFKEAGVIRLEKTVLQVRPSWMLCATLCRNKCVGNDKVIGLEDILVRHPSVADYLPRSHRRKWLKATQLFPYLYFLATGGGSDDEITRDENNDNSYTRICVRPADCNRPDLFRTEGRKALTLIGDFGRTR